MIRAKATESQEMTIITGSVNFLLLYKRLDIGAFSWPRSKDQAMQITDDQYKLLMGGFDIIARHPICEMRPPEEIAKNYCAKVEFLSFQKRLVTVFMWIASETH